jgi:hypothetical protein
MAQLFEADFQGSGSSATTGPTKREDLADYIALVDAKDTPFTSMAPKGKDLGNMYHRWSADAHEATTTEGYRDGLDATSTVAGGLGNGVSHGTDYAPYIQNHARNRDELSNYAQYFRRATKVSPLAAEVTNPVGGKALLAQGIAKKTVELKRDMEATFLSDNAPVLETTGGSAVPYKTRGMGKWTTNGGGGVLPIPTSFDTPTASIADVGTGTTSGATDLFTESMVQGVLESIYGETGNIRSYDLIAGTKIKRAFTNLTSTEVESVASTASTAATSVRTFNQELGNTTFKSTITVFEGDFGTLTVHVDNFLPATTTAYVIPMEMTEIRYGMLPRVGNIPNSGAGEGRIVEAVASLVVKNPLAFGKFHQVAD